MCVVFQEAVISPVADAVILLSSTLLSMGFFGYGVKLVIKREFRKGLVVIVTSVLGYFVLLISYELLQPLSSCPEGFF